MSSKDKDKYYDPAERAREKAASREADERALASGEKTREQLRKENGSFAFPRAIIRFDLLRGKRY